MDSDVIGLLIIAWIVQAVINRNKTADIRRFASEVEGLKERLVPQTINKHASRSGDRTPPLTPDSASPRFATCV